MLPPKVHQPGMDEHGGEQGFIAVAVAYLGWHHRVGIIEIGQSAGRGKAGRVID